MAPRLVLDKITKRFPGVLALDEAKLSVEAGSVHALMGENGAGKSTLMKCLFGVYKPDGGRILIDGEEVSFKNPKEALLGGVAMVHQELNQALKLSVMDNMWLGRYPKILGWLPIVNRSKMIKDTQALFDELGIAIRPEATMASLSVSKRQMVEIAKAVSYGAKIIVFDEPTSSLTEEESERLFSIIKRLRDGGCGIIYISHKMSEILRISDTVTVMRDGKHIETAIASDMTTDRIIHLMVGREIIDRYPKRSTPPGKILFEADNLTGKHSRLSSVSLTLREGEVLGIAGLDGSGRTELLEAIFGLSARKSGIMRLRGETVKNRNPIESKRSGFALITEERRRDGIFGILNIRENATISSLNKFTALFFLKDKKRSFATKDIIKKMRVKCPTELTKISTLSGGNQQKVILGRWLLTDPSVLLLDEPTRGIDIGAKHEIYLLINKLAEGGRGVILVSSEMAELLGVCDRIIVMSGGRVAGEVNAKDATQEKIMELAAKFV